MTVAGMIVVRSGSPGPHGKSEGTVSVRDVNNLATRYAPPIRKAA